MPAGATDAADLLEVGLGPGTQPIHERLERVPAGSILCLELAQLRLGAAQDELGKRRGVGAQSRAKRLERSGKRGSLGDRVMGMRRRRRPSVPPCSTDPAGRYS
jgi:hypothetical protein